PASTAAAGAARCSSSRSARWTPASLTTSTTASRCRWRRSTSSANRSVLTAATTSRSGSRKSSLRACSSADATGSDRRNSHDMREKRPLYAAAFSLRALSPDAASHSLPQNGGGCGRPAPAAMTHVLLNNVDHHDLRVLPLGEESCVNQVMVFPN